MAPRVKDKFIDGSDGGCGLIATAPYNFISLPSDICVPKGWKNIDFEVCDPDDESNKKKSKEKIEELYNTYVQYVHDHGKHSGYIEVDITTRTSTLVGGFGESSEKSSFFSIQNDEPMIPGSSLRGMIRNLFKTVTASSFREGEDFTEKTLYYRSFAAPKHALGAKEAYMETMRIGNKTTKAKDLRKRGFLVRTRTTQGVEWNIYECNLSDCKTKDYKTPKPKSKEAREKFSGDVKWKDVDKAKRVDITINCLNGKNDNKFKNNSYVFIWNKGQKYKVDKHVIEAYRLDEKRKGLDVLKDCAKKGTDAVSFSEISTADLIAPCFFTVKDGRVIHFGAPVYYRIPYTNSIGAHVPSTLKTKKVDYTDLVFGLKEYWGGRLSFGDAKLSEASLKKGKYLDTTEIPVALLGPNPTSFQLYLDQEGNDDKCLHWDIPEANIRGVKHYWHRKVGKNEGTDNVTTKCKNRVNPNVTFTGKIYFQSLTTEELGALCKVLFLGTGSNGDKFSTRNEERQYKIGKGKSIGWGSVSITSKLFLEREETYNKVNMWTDMGIAPMYQEVDLEKGQYAVDTLISSFDAYTKESMKGHYKSLEKAIKELYIMMDPEALGDDQLEKTKMMSINTENDKRFVDRTSLLPVDKFVNVSLKGYLPEKNK